MRSGVDVDVACLPEWDGRDGDPADDAPEQRVAVHVVGQRLERQHQPMAKDVEDHVEHVLGQHVVAAADEGQGPRGQDQVDRGTRTRPEGDVALELGQPVPFGRAGRGRDA